jgi:geranylgeranylglycerol-phosphate geranylgeranyltransferase
MGIKEGYPRIPLSMKVKAYVQLCRPLTLVAPIIAGLIGTLAPAKTIGLDEIRIGIYAGVTLALLQGAGQIINQYSDYEIDKIVKPYRPIPKGIVERDEALGVGILLMWFGIMRGFWISLTFGTICMLLAFMAVYYSLSPLSPRRVNEFYNITWLALSRGTLPVISVWSIYGNIVESIPYAVIVTCWVLAFQPTKDIPDAEADKRFGIKTIPNTYGVKGYTVWASIITVWMMILIGVFDKMIMMPLILVALFNIFTLNRKSGRFENTWAWIGFYMGLALAYILIFVDLKVI